ncbi:MAG TPA: uroporphyrinogen-III C-methyltransferase, partial [Gammaproteobacteria bacterium]
SVFNEGLATDDIAKGSEQQGLQQLRDRLAASEDSLRNPQGEVYLVGAGPGNPDLLTFRALKLMQQADVVLYDRLVSAEILDRVRRDAEKIDVGKSRDRHLQTQDKINELMLHYAKQGKRVCRLKGGDPFIFGRGGEELELLAEHGIRFEVVPGVTAATGAATYAGIPLTHRDYAQSCIFVTGHVKDGELALAGDLDWKSLTRPMQTVVFYMGLKNLPLVSEHLLQNGMRADMPAALVENATLPEQRVVTGTITTLPALAHKHNLQPPALLIIGEVVKLQGKLAWFKEAKPNIQSAD